ncbi:MAG: PAS domain-containing protein [Elusimicrobia bacterium]|nr:PAS domain-containing protein [Elusimicrobiota bacterium]
MRLVDRIALLLLPLLLAATAAVLLLSRGAIRSALVAQVERDAMAHLRELARDVQRPLATRDELRLLPHLQAARSGTEGLYAAALDASGRIVAHTDVAQVGAIPADPFARDALAARQPVAVELSRGGQRVIEAAAPVWDGAPDPEALMFSHEGRASRARLGAVRLAVPLRPALQTERQITRQIATILVLAGALGVAGALLIVRAALRPVRELTRAATEVGLGNYEARVAAGAKDELGDLAEAFNRMAATLGKTTVSKEFLDAVLASMREPLAVLRSDGRVRSLNRAALDLVQGTETEWVDRHARELFVPDTRPWIDAALAAAGEGGAAGDLEAEFSAADGRRVPVLLSATALRDKTGRRIGLILTARDITDRKRAERVLAEQAARLERSNADLAQFAYAASHDLQEPLRKISGFAELLGRRYRGRLDADADRYIELLTSGVSRMQALISDLLAYSRAGREEVPLEPVDLGEVLDGVLADFERAIADSGAVVERDPMPTLPARGTEMRQLFQNLLSNAVKFRGSEPPRIRVSARREGGDWLLSVRDNGIGIPPEHQAQVFELFRRLHPHARYPGTGIGLALCKKIVESHGGRIWLESAPGGGSTFYFTLRGAPPERRKEEG